MNKTFIFKLHKKGRILYLYAKLVCSIFKELLKFKVTVNSFPKRKQIMNTKNPRENVVFIVNVWNM